MDSKLIELANQFRRIHGIDLPLGDPPWTRCDNDKAVDAIQKCLRPMTLRECVQILAEAGLLATRELWNPINALIQKYVKPHPFPIPQEIRQVWDKYLAEIEANWRDG